MLYDNERNENIARLSFILEENVFESNNRSIFESKVLEREIFKINISIFDNRSYRSIIVSILAIRAIKVFVLRSYVATRANKALVLAIEARTIVVKLSKSSIVTIAALRVNILSSLAIKVFVLITKTRAIAIRISLRKFLIVEIFLIKAYKASRNRLIYYINKTSIYFIGYSEEYIRYYVYYRRLLKIY